MTLEQLLKGSLLGNRDADDAVASHAVAPTQPLLSLVAPGRAAEAAPRDAQRRSRRPACRTRYVDATFESDEGSRDYRLYGPVVPTDGQPSLIVMLHGAGQDHTDFALATRMHESASCCGAYVVYPAQAKKDNPAQAWNWFRDFDQQRGQGEPAILAAMTREIVAEYDINPRRVYVAGLSAGAAMAVVLGRAYPDVFAAVGAHSGLPYKAASNVYAAFDAMARGPSGADVATEPGGVPTIVFHGDRDTTVHPRNATAIVEQALGSRVDDVAMAAASKRTDDMGERAYTTTVFRDPKGRTIAEQWVVHDAEHTWSGGAATPHSDPRGPDASAEMLRFFQSHRLEPRRAR